MIFVILGDFSNIEGHYVNRYFWIQGKVLMKKKKLKIISVNQGHLDLLHDTATANARDSVKQLKFLLLIKTKKDGKKKIVFDFLERLLSYCTEGGT